MSTDFVFPDFQEIPEITDAEVENLKNTLMPPFRLREMFRPILMSFFEQTNKGNGSYKWAEEKTKEWFTEQYGLNPIVWNYRNN